MRTDGQTDVFPNLPGLVWWGFINSPVHLHFTYKSSISIKVISKVPNMQHGRVLAGPGLLNKPFKTGRSANPTHVSVDQELRWPILTKQNKI